MIKIENVEVVGWENAIRGMRNPLNSHDKSDRFECDVDDCQDGKCPHHYVEDGYAECGKFKHRNLMGCDYIIGNNDLTLMKKLAKAGTDHRKFMRMIVVYCDMTAPLYLWKEIDTYKVGTVRNSCSTMHTLSKHEITIKDFSIDDPNLATSDMDILHNTLYEYIEMLEDVRTAYNETKNSKYWKLLIQLLPESYNQKATLMLNYEVLANIYRSRRNHKLTEWQTFCKWIETLPYSELITGEE